MKLDVSTKEYCTIRLALIQWGVRCEGEAKVMDEFAADMDEKGDAAHADKARRNAAASRQFKADAEALLKALP